ncbi:MAG: metal-dependent transcriptional regulator [Desulfurococcales archaeon]|nr:metal-dependent transcriptional regulator [Desulfurococcales archaeon]
MYALQREYGRIRIKDIAERLNVKPSSVIEYLRRLMDMGYVIYKPGTRIRLTEKGKKVGEAIYQKHLVIKEFLILLGVPEDIAETDACYIEHGIHKITLEKITNFIKKCREKIIDLSQLNN